MFQKKVAKHVVSLKTTSSVIALVGFSLFINYNLLKLILLPCVECQYFNSYFIFLKARMSRERDNNRSPTKAHHTSIKECKASFKKFNN
jgi:hypothetical protein